MSEPQIWTTEDVADRLKDLFAEQAPPEHTALVDAAAVLVLFDREALHPFGVVRDPVAARQELLAVAEPTGTVDGRNRWTLGRSARRESLRRLLEAGQIEAALDANPDRDRDVVQEVLETLLTKPRETPVLKGIAQVRACQIVADWLTGLVPGVPDPVVLRTLAERETQLAPFRELVGEYFAGRTLELAALADYVDILAPTDVRETVTRALRAVFSIVSEPPLFVFGPGGIGKSTLIAKFILDHVDDPRVPQFPYAYLDLDRPGLVAEEPITLLIEALRQLAMQYPDARASLSALQRDWAAKIGASSRPPVTPQALGQTEGVEPDSATSQALPGVNRRPGEFQGTWSRLRLSGRDYYIETFAEAVRALQPGSQPMLLVIDTFEQIQLRSEAYVSEVFRFLDQLQRQLPFVRTVISGRVLPDHQLVKPLELKVFDVEAAAAFLTARVRIDRNAAERLARQLSRSPLTLKLAVGLLRKFDAVAIGVADLDAVIGDLHRGSIEAQLFTRVLGHIADPDVRKLAFPGLVVRRITPEVIKDVLAGPCGLPVPDLTAATALWDKLRAEVVLVVERSRGVLIHRPDLRAVMLEHLRIAEPTPVQQIHEAAITYYERQPADPELRAEEIYHRLSMGFDRAKLESRWIDGLDPYLAQALPELPPRAQGFLAARLEVSLDPAVRAQVDIADWERYAIREVTKLLSVSQLDDALALLAVRTDSSSVDLRLLQVEALARAGKQDEARQVGAAILASVPPDSDAARTVRERFGFANVTAESSIQPAVGRLGEALTDAFPDRASLLTLLRAAHLEALAVRLPAESPIEQSARQVSDLGLAMASLAATEHQLAALVLTARRLRPDNARLWSAADALGLLARGLSDTSAIRQSIYQRRSQGELRTALTSLEAQTCCISVGPGFLTGFLVGPDLILTSATIAADAQMDKKDWRAQLRDRLSVTFDQWTTDTDVTMPGTQVGLANDWLIALSLPPEMQGDGLGYALVRVAQPIGNERGWMVLARDAHPPPKAAVATLRFDSRKALIFSLSSTGMRGRDDERRRLRYEIEGEPGGSGSPVFDQDLQIVAVHVARATGWLAALTSRAVREGAPSDLILEDLRRRGITLATQNPAPPSSQAV